jgi:hypothetical protein
MSTRQIKSYANDLLAHNYFSDSGGNMDAIFSFFGNLNYEVIAQLTLVGLIMLSGPIVIFLLALRGGDM